MQDIQNLLGQIPMMLPRYCDRCGTQYSREDLEIINKDQHGLTCQINCSNCQNTYMINVNADPMTGVISGKRASIKTEVSGKELKKFSKMNSIQKDEVLDVYVALDKVETIKDFEILFERK